MSPPAPPRPVQGLSSQKRVSVMTPQALERLRSRPVEVAVKDDERGPLARLLPPDLERGAESASCAEYAVRCGGGDEQIQRAHVLAAPCFTRVTSAIAYQY